MAQEKPKKLPGEDSQFQRNPIVQTCYSTDPAPMVDGDRLYVFTGHDEEKADFFWMNDWRLFSTSDMANWTDHGCPLAQCDFSWADDRAWAPQCIKRNGKYYFYVPVHSKLSGGMAIGVAVSDNVTGPYTDPLGKPLYDNGSWDHIDPTVLIDSDNQAYLYWGNPKLYSVKLNDDMISLQGEPSSQKPENYVEGPWIMKQGKKYFMVYAAHGIPEGIAYSESDSPMGPWKYVGDIMAPQGDVTQSFTNHSGTVTFKGHNYFFYHTGWLPNGGGFGRSVCVEEFDYKPDGHFPALMPKKEGVTPIGTLNPYQRVEGETMAFSYGVKTEWNDEDGVFLSDIHNGDWIRLSEVNFDAQKPYKNGAQWQVRAASALQGGIIEMRLDSLRGQLVATTVVPKTGGNEKFQVINTEIEKLPTGKHEVFLLFKGLKGPKLMNLDYWQIIPNHDKYEARNPLFWADYPDPDIIRVGEYYYLVTTTMHLMPGAPIMRSKDLKNWETVSYLFDELKDIPAYDLDGGTKYGQGQWATSLRYHKGKFYALFVTNGVPGSWIYSTEDPAKGWKLHSHLKGFYHDPSLFFDDDDRVYIFSGGGKVDVTELESDLSKEKEGGFNRKIEVQDAFDHGLLEGSRVIKHNGYYYLIMISWPRTGRHQLAYRAKTLDGRWEKRDILTDNFDQFGNVGQGTIVDGPDGKWYGVIFQDRGGVGRILTLSPVRWVDDWPIIGDHEGHVTPCAEVSTVTNDRQWNHNPDKTAFKYTAKTKTLELRTASVVDNIFMARNTLTWRMWGPECSDAICLDISGMKDGDRAGFSAFNGDAGLLTICKDGGKTVLKMTEESVVLNDQKQVTDNKVSEKASVDITAKKIWLKINGDFNLGRDIATFEYSLDGKNFQKIGSDFKMRFDYRRLFMGTRYAVFNYATKQKGGKVTVLNLDWEK
ncbi:MAG: family 43 glycosylhydrolase [Bacteroidales bacterium]|nr:family 43 glycosylhydrolase [Bacteroidales bacterium]